MKTSVGDVSKREHSGQGPALLTEEVGLGLGYEGAKGLGLLAQKEKDSRWRDEE